MDRDDIHLIVIENLPSAVTAASNVTSINRDSFMIVGCFIFNSSLLLLLIMSAVET